MNIIIIGCGKLGASLTARLIDEGHNITVIDENEQVLEDLIGTYDVQGICGNGVSYHVQMEAGIDSADLVIAVTDSDEMNLLCCLIAEKAAEVPTIACISNPVYREEMHYITDGIGLDMAINPQYESAAEIYRVLRRRTVIDINPFAKGRVELMSFKIDRSSPLTGMSISNISVRLKSDILVAAVDRNGDVFIPEGNFVLQAGDKVSILATAGHAKEFFRKAGMPTNSIKNCMIVGGGDTAFYLAQLLISYGMNVKIIERSMSRCEELTTLLPKAIIISADGTDKNLLLEQGLEYEDAFVTLTDMDEENVLLSLFAQQNSDAKIVTKINRLTFDSVIAQMELGTLVYPQNIVSDHILRYVRARVNSMNSTNVETLYKINDGKAEALEFKVRQSSEITGRPLSEMKIRSNTLVGCISREDRILIPHGQDTIEVGDSVVIVTTQKGINALQDIIVR